MRTALSEPSFAAAWLAAALLCSAFLTTNTFSQAARTGKATQPSPVRVADDRTASLQAGKSLAELEDQMAAALAAAEAALASEEERLDELAARHSRRRLADGRPSVAQAAANARLWDRRIREMETDERELLEALTGTLASLDADIASLIQRLSAQREKAERDKKARERAERERIAHEKAQRERAQRERAEAERRAREKAERERVEREKAAHAVGRVFRDCPDCPEMIVVPSGRFTMGSPRSEQGRQNDEGPAHPVTIQYRFAVSVHEVTRGEFGRFVAATNRVMGDSCWTLEGKWIERAGVGWRNPVFSQEDNHPVVCVSWRDAKAYVRWLLEQTGKRYRLLSEAEWEYAARAGTTVPFHFGATISTDQANYHGSYTYGSGREGVYLGRTTPVGSFPANGFGLHDMHGNVWEWVEDCWHEDYSGAPTDGSAWLSGGTCERRVLRGGSWYNAPWNLRSADRAWFVAGYRPYAIGFRVARTLAR